MAAEELRDSLGRLRISAQTDAWLQAETLATGESKHDIARRVLHERALLERRKSQYLERLWPCEGGPGTDGGEQ